MAFIDNVSIRTKVIAAFDLKGSAAAFEVFLDAILEPKGKGRARAPFASSPFQTVERDFAFLLDTNVSADEVIKAAKSAERALIERVDVFDLYEGKGIPDGKKSLAIAVRLQPKDRTLTDAEIEAIAQKIVEHGADYVLALKGNHPMLEQAVERFFVTGPEAEASRIFWNRERSPVFTAWRASGTR